MELAIVVGLATGALLWMAARWGWLAWVALTPLAYVLAFESTTTVALAAALAGGIASAESVSERAMRALLPITMLPSALAWGSGFALAGWLMPSPEWVLVAAPWAVFAATLPLRWMGAPRWVSNPLACTQERVPSIVHTARWGGDATTSAVIALANATLVMVGVTWWWLAGAFMLTIALGLGQLSWRRARSEADACKTVRVAALVADVPVDVGPVDPSASRDLDAAIRRYEPLVKQAADAQARIIVFPEVAVYLDEATRDTWLETVRHWAEAHDLVVVSPYFDCEYDRNELLVVDRDGTRARYAKQHPARGIEPPRCEVMAPGPHRLGEVDLCTAICVDIDYTDLLETVSRSGGLLAAPSNDWFGGFEERHHRGAIWTAVCTGVTVVRATGHGVSAVYDGAGRVLARASSEHGPVALLIDAPIAAPAS